MSDVNRLLVRRVLTLVVVGTVSGVLAYVVHGGQDDATPAVAVAQQQRADEPAPPGTPPELDAFASCMRDHGVTLAPRGRHAGVDFRAAFLACRGYLPERPFGRDGDLEPRDDGPVLLLPTA
jgi:hypothetical protein